MIEIMVLSALIIAISIAFLCVKLFFYKDGEFASQHVHDNPGLRKKRIHCVIEQDREAREKSPMKICKEND